jgi:hypothetical protein
MVQITETKTAGFAYPRTMALTPELVARLYRVEQIPIPRERADVGPRPAVPGLTRDSEGPISWTG